MDGPSDVRDMVMNLRRTAAERAAPASSFKIPNRLIALEEGAVADVDEVIPWDGEPQRIPAWEQDLSMREAYPLSAVPHYQELARRVGVEAYEEWVAELDYGNAEIGEVVDRFWLDGPLEISAEEQVHFLDDFYRGAVPGDPDNLAQVHEIMVQVDYADASDQVIRAKTCLGDRPCGVGGARCRASGNSPIVCRVGVSSSP